GMDRSDGGEGAVVVAAVALEIVAVVALLGRRLGGPVAASSRAAHSGHAGEPVVAAVGALVALAADRRARRLAVAVAGRLAVAVAGRLAVAVTDGIAVTVTGRPRGLEVAAAVVVDLPLRAREGQAATQDSRRGTGRAELMIEGRQGHGVNWGGRDRRCSQPESRKCNRTHRRSEELDRARVDRQLVVADVVGVAAAELAVEVDAPAQHVVGLFQDRAGVVAARVDLL